MSVVAQESVAPVQQAQVELADIFTRHGDTYAASHYVSLAKHKVMRAIVDCRTAVCLPCSKHFDGDVGFFEHRHRPASEVSDPPVSGNPVNLIGTHDCSFRTAN